LTLQQLPALNAALNATCAALLCLAFYFIRRRNIPAHKATMVLAVIVSALFLTSYLFYHFHAGSTRFTGVGTIRAVYFTVLISHTILAMVIVPLVIVTLFRAWRTDFARHARVARWTWPLWMYVSVTGVVIYWMLYRL